MRGRLKGSENNKFPDVVVQAQACVSVAPFSQHNVNKKCLARKMQICI